jgi:hypothetical protein
MAEDERMNETTYTKNADYPKVTLRCNEVHRIEHENACVEKFVRSEFVTEWQPAN